MNVLPKKEMVSKPYFEAVVNVAQTLPRFTTCRRRQEAFRYQLAITRVSTIEANFLQTVFRALRYAVRLPNG